MKTFNFCLLLSVSVLLFSCKKSGVSPCRISQVVQDNNPVKTITFKYDEDGRPTEAIASEYHTKYKFTYTGLTGKLEYIDMNTNAVTATINLTFDAQERLKSFEEKYVPAADTLRYFYQFEYNADGFLFRNIQTLTGGGNNIYYCDSLIYDNGNVTKMFSVLNDGTVDVESNYEYSTELNSQWNFFFSISSGGEPFSILSSYYILSPLLGKATKNLPTKVTTTGSYSEVNDFTYTTDLSKKVTAYTQVRNYNSTITTKNFKLSYTCD